MSRTVQLRRYRLVPGTLSDFVDWFGSRLVPARLAGGFRIEFAYAVPESGEFVWAVSVEGDEAEFHRVDEAYLDSPERHAAFDDVPQRVEAMTLQFVQPLAVQP